MKTYVLFVSRRFPAYHPRKGEDTGFEDRIIQNFHPRPEVFLNGKWTRDYKIVNIHTQEEFMPPSPKLHTIREKYDTWAKRAEEINAGKAVLSLRYWSGSPYNSKKDDSKHVEFMQLTKIHVDKIHINFNGGEASVGFTSIDLDTLAKNDGLSEQDLRAWFKADKNPVFEGCIIHFTDFRYDN